MNGKSIGSWLDTKCGDVEADRLLTTRLCPFIVNEDGMGCLGGAAFGYVGSGQVFAGAGDMPWFDRSDMPERFNRLAQRLAGIPHPERVGFAWSLAGKGKDFRGERFQLGGARAGELIRNRILSNRARRMLAGVTETCAAVSAVGVA